MQPVRQVSVLATRVSGREKSLAAAIDVGSHETVMRIAEMRMGKAPKDIEVVHRTLPLGSNTYSEGEISQALLDQLIQILQSFRLKLAEYGDMPVVITATSAFREASNVIYGAEQIRRHAGYDIDVLSNSIETSLHLLGLAATLDQYADIVKDTTLIVDIRAGSIQLSLYDQGALINSLNFRIGALRVRELLGDLERQAIDYSALLTEFISGDLDYYQTLGPKRTTYKHLIVIGGNMRFMRHLLELEPEQSQIAVSNFKILYARLAGRKDSWQRIMDIPDEHRTLLLPTAIIIDEVARHAGVDTIIVPKVSLSSCLLYDLAQRRFKVKAPYDVNADLISLARQVARRYRTDKQHAMHVENLALKLFDLTKKMHDLKKDDRLCLQLAAILHNVGKYIAIQDDGSATLSVLTSTEFIGLTPERKQLVALLACYHNGNVTIGDYHVRQLPEPLRLVLMKLIALLAVANSLDAGHAGKIQLIRARETDQGLALTYEALADVTLEMWHFRHHRPLFSQIFGVEPYLVRRPAREADA